VSRIFISYRRQDSDIWVSRLVDELRQASQAFDAPAYPQPKAIPVR
jgi:hypothetical protein